MMPVTPENLCRLPDIAPPMPESFDPEPFDPRSFDGYLPQLDAHPWFAALPPALRAALLARAVLRRLPAGHALFPAAATRRAGCTRCWAAPSR